MSPALAIACVLGLAGVASAGGPAGTPPTACVAAAPPAAAVASGASLTLRDAVAAAVDGNPALIALSCEMRAREAAIEQARLRPNPELGLGVENVAGSGARRDDEQAETTVLLSQRFELGGKRDGRARVAALERDRAAWDYEVKRRAVVQATVTAFVATLAAQERVTLAEEREQLADRTVGRVQAQVDVGAASPVDRARAEVAAGRAAVARRRAGRDLAAARAALAAAWGSREPTFARVDGTLHDLEEPPSLDAVARGIEQSPAVARWQTEQAGRQARLALSESGRIPDVTVGAGGRYFSDNGDGALVVELSVPLPVLNRNQGAIAAARHRAAGAAAEGRAAATGAWAAAARAHARLLAAQEEARGLRERVLPAARSAVAGAEQAFRSGLIHFTDLLDAELALFDLRAEEIDALEAARVAAAEVARLTGAPVAAAGEEHDS